MIRAVWTVAKIKYLQDVRSCALLSRISSLAEVPVLGISNYGENQ